MSNIYTTTKYSYKENHECFLPGIFCHTAVSEEQLLQLVKAYLTTCNVKEAWMSKDDENVFYVTYNDAYEQGNYHGYRVSITDMTTGKVTELHKDTYPDLWDKINTLVNETI